MTPQIIHRENKLILVFDICSSSNIIEDLTLTGNVIRFHSLIASLQKWLEDRERTEETSVYKFVGDGWIILFSYHVSGQLVLDFMVGLSSHFLNSMRKDIIPCLECKPNIIGLTFGIERGELVRFNLSNENEFVGRALNIACRLQNAVKDKGTSPEFRVLVSNQVYNFYFKKLPGLKAFRVTRVLRNIRNGEQYRCVKFNLAHLIK